MRRTHLRWLLTLSAVLLAGLPARSAEPLPEARTSYVAYRFDAPEGWSLRGAGNAEGSRWTDKHWTLDFSHEAAWIGLAPPDHSLLGRPTKIRIRVRGTAKGHPVELFLRTHFMTFHKVVGQFAGPGEQELVVDAPPGPGWQWLGGENDGKIHGPLRVGEIRVAGAGLRDRVTLELLDVIVETTCPARRRCVLVAEAKEEAGKVHFSAWARALTERPLEGKVTWQLRSWEGREPGRGEQPVSIPAGAELKRVELPPFAVPEGLRFVEAEFRLEVPGQEVPPAQAYWLAPRAGQGDATPRPDSPMGMGLYLGRLHGEDMERAARAARAAGVKWSREDFTWARIEPEKGHFDWSYYDRLLDCARRNGITVYAIAGYWAPWTKPYTPEGIDDYLHYVRELVKRYHKDIKQWEIWNEPNIFFWQGPKELYATLLKKCYAAIKEVDPSAQVLGLSTAGIDTRFIKDMLARQAPFDVLTIHPYRRVLDDRKFIDDLKQVSDLVALPGGKRRPVWLTEMGWTTNVPHNALAQDFQPVTEREQAVLLARSYLCALVSGVDPRTFWYDFRDDGDDPFYFEHHLGTVTRDFRPKPAYLAYATLAELVRDRRVEAALDTKDGIFAYRLVPRDGQSGSVVAVWSPDRDATVRLPVRGTRVTRVNAVGETEQLDATPGDRAGTGTVRVTVRKGAPVYLVETSGEVYHGHVLPRLRGAMISPSVTADDLRVLGKQWGANHIRWQLCWDGFPHSRADRVSLDEYDAWLEKSLAHLDELLPVCRGCGLRVLIDLHTSPGGRDKASACRLFQDKHLQEHFLELWKQMARRYRGNTTVWGYDLLNEPVEGTVAEGLHDWHALAEETAQAVRAIDPEHAIIVEPAKWGNPEGLKSFAPLKVSGVVYSVHMYLPHKFTHQGVGNSTTNLSYPGELDGRRIDKESLRAALRPAVEYQRAHHVAMYIGEFSAIRWAPGSSACNYLRDVIDLFEEQGWDWAYHAFREWDGWSVEHGSDKNDHARSKTPTDREQLLRSWFAKNQKPGDASEK